MAPLAFTTEAMSPERSALGFASRGVGAVCRGVAGEALEPRRVVSVVSVWVGGAAASSPNRGRAIDRLQAHVARILVVLIIGFRERNVLRSYLKRK